jgi:urea carboxylase
MQVPDYLGSKSTFTLGQFGGHAGARLRAGDVLHLPPLSDRSVGAQLPETQLAACRAAIG